MASMSTPPFSITLRVYWEDTDAGGVVYYANYLKFFERARTEWLRALGLEQRYLQKAAGGVFVVSEANAKYLRPARLDDQLRVTTHLRDMGRSTCTIDQEIQRIGAAEAEVPQVLCQGTIRIAWVDSQTFRSARIPAVVQDALAKT
jgi:acyl-CoA thioester hydrolase